MGAEDENVIVELKQSIDCVFKRIRGAAKRAGRNADEITLVAACKGVSLDRIRKAAACGITVFGENRVQEAHAKFLESGLLKEARSISIHLIGPLQSNKAKRAVGFFDLIHSIDSFRLAEKVEREAERRSRVQPILVEVNMGEEASKRGISMKETPALVGAIRKLPHLALLGLMALPPPTSDPEGARPYFSMLREIGLSLGLNQFSMGMSADFDVAIEEGATWVRIGTAIFGPRPA